VYGLHTTRPYHAVNAGAPPVSLCIASEYHSAFYLASRGSVQAAPPVPPLVSLSAMDGTPQVSLCIWPAHTTPRP
jgi:hypothetical protein